MPDDTCSVDECTRPIKVKVRRLCGMHDMRRRRTGSVQDDRPCRDDRRPDGHLWCSRCSTLKPPEMFYRNRSAKTGYDGVCKACTNKRRRDTAAHRAVVMKEWRSRPDVRERVLAQKRESWRANRDYYLRKGREWRQNNPDRVRLQIRAQNAAREARTANAPGYASTGQITARWAYYGGLCWMCGDLATDTDHVKPLARGGSNWPANLRPACKPCNRAKWAAWPMSEIRARLAATEGERRREDPTSLAEADHVNRRIEAPSDLGMDRRCPVG